MRTVSWQSWWDNQEPKSESDVENERIKELRWELNVDPEMTYTLEELEELDDEQR